MPRQPKNIKRTRDKGLLQRMLVALARMLGWRLQPAPRPVTYRQKVEKTWVPIAEVKDREKISVCGTVTSITYTPRPYATGFQVSISDNTGSLILRWPGRHTVPGIHAGTLIEATGVVGSYPSGRAMIHPMYRLLTSYETAD